MATSRTLTATLAITCLNISIAASSALAQVDGHNPPIHYMTEALEQGLDFHRAPATQGRKAGVERDSVQLRNASSDDIANARQTLCNNLTRRGRARASCASDEQFMVDSCQCTGYPRPDRNYYHLGCTVRWRCALQGDSPGVTSSCISPRSGSALGR